MSREILTYFSYNAFSYNNISFFTKQHTIVYRTHFVYIRAGRFEPANSVCHYLSKRGREVLEVKRDRWTHDSS